MYSMDDNIQSILHQIQTEAEYENPKSHHRGKNRKTAECRNSGYTVAKAKLKKGGITWPGCDTAVIPVTDLSHNA